MASLRTALRCKLGSKVAARSAQALRPIHRKIGVPHDFGCARVSDHPGRDPDARGGVQRLIVYEDRLIERAQQSFPDGECLRVARNLLEQHRKLIAAKSR